MRPGFRLLFASTVALASLWPMLVSPVLAASDQEWKDCRGLAGSDRAIAACTRILQGSGETTHNRAVAYVNPLTYYVGLMRNILLKGGETVYVLRQTGILALLTAVLLFFSYRRFHGTLD